MKYYLFNNIFYFLWLYVNKALAANVPQTKKIHGSYFLPFLSFVYKNYISQEAYVVSKLISDFSFIFFHL